MPTFIDRHPTKLVAPAVRRRLHVGARQKTIDPHGVRPVASWMEDGAIFCIVEAPDEDAVCGHHTELGLPCDDVHLIDDLQQLSPLTEQDQAMVRAAIARLWHSDSPPVAA